MRLRVLLLVVFVGATVRAEVDPAVPKRGDVDAQLGVDVLSAGTRQDAPGSGSPADLGAQELGVRVRLRARDLPRRLALHLDFQGREPVGGELTDTPIRLLYRGELAYEAIEKRLTLGVGRFVTPSVVFLPVDGIRAEYMGDSFTASIFGGRRGVTTSRRNVDLGRWLPAAGATVGWEDKTAQVEAHASWSDDELVLTKGSAGAEAVKPFASWSGYVRALWRPRETIFTGAQATLAQQATYVLGPTWKALRVELNSLELWNAVIWADWRPWKVLRFGVDVHTQAIGPARAGLLSGPPVAGSTTPTLVAGIQDPNFTDTRLKAAWRGLDAGWLRADVRYRRRNDRSELRSGLSLDVDRIGVAGLFARAAITNEDVTFDAAGKPDLDRLLWSASVGHRSGGLEAEAGASYIDRAAGPISSRIFNAASPTTPSSPVDLSPFVLDAQRFAFLRAFYSARNWFAGVDLQQNLEDASERRVFLQVGALGEESW